MPCNNNHTYRQQNVSQKHPRQATAGFSLIELLVVIVIAAILFTCATLAIRGHDPEEVLHHEALRFNQLIQLALEQAILRGENYALEIHINGYRFLQFKQQNWTQIKNDPLLRARQLPADMELELNLEDTQVVIDPAANMGDRFSLDSKINQPQINPQSGDHSRKHKKSTDPQIYLLSSGEITPEFSVRFFFPTTAKSYLVSGKFNGQHKVTVSDL